MMRGIGINCDDGRIDGKIERLEEDLARCHKAGFDLYEMSVNACNAIIGGRVDNAELRRVSELFSRWPLHYTLHGPAYLSMADPRPVAKQVMESCLEVASRIGAEVVVYHSALTVLRRADRELEPMVDEAHVRDLWQRETAALRDAGRLAQSLNVAIAIENLPAYEWELAALARHGKDARDVGVYAPRMRLNALADQVAEIDLPNVGVCLDVGHAATAVSVWGRGDLVSEVRRIAPLVRHVHFHDNFGRIDGANDSPRDRLIFGETDNHLPPGWGLIPLGDILTVLHQGRYNGWIVNEILPRYMDEQMANVARISRSMIAAAASR